MSKKVGKLKVKGKKYTLGCQIIKFEKKCFDWVCAGKEITDVHDGWEVTDTTLKRKHHIISRIYFKRPFDYQKNFIFKLTELISNIISFFRVTVLNFLFPAVIIGAILMFANQDSTGLILGIYFGVYGGLIGASLLFACLGLLWRKVFKLREKTDEIQEKNGFVPWSDYEDDLSVDFDYRI